MFFWFRKNWCRMEALVKRPWRWQWMNLPSVVRLVLCFGINSPNCWIKNFLGQVQVSGKTCPFQKEGLWNLLRKECLSSKQQALPNGHDIRQKCTQKWSSCLAVCVCVCVSQTTLGIQCLEKKNNQNWKYHETSFFKKKKNSLWMALKGCPDKSGSLKKRLRSKTPAPLSFGRKELVAEQPHHVDQPLPEKKCVEPVVFCLSGWWFFKSWVKMYESQISTSQIGIGRPV